MTDSFKDPAEAISLAKEDPTYSCAIAGSFLLLGQMVNKFYDEHPDEKLPDELKDFMVEVVRCAEWHS